MMIDAGSVWLVGAGPGDPGLLTVRGRQALEQADCVVYDYLVHPRILDHIRPDAERLFVGKKAGARIQTQDEINDLLVERATKGQVVVRLKGGDPFFFGRGGEECERLKMAGIPFRIVPGVTSGIAAPAYAGIPVTHRDDASSAVFLTGHFREGVDDDRHDWDALARVGTIVIYMGVGNFPQISQKLQGAGMAAGTPAAAVRWGTWNHQQVVVSTLEHLADDMARAAISSPAIIVVGSVARHARNLDWFRQGPLAGRTVAVPRIAGRAGQLVPLLEEAGARVLALDTAEIAAPVDGEPLRKVLADIAAVDVLAFQSRLGVRCFMQALLGAGHDLRTLASVRLAAQGSGCIDELSRFHLQPDIVPDGSVVELFSEEITKVTEEHHRIMVLGAEDSRRRLQHHLQQAGRQVDSVPTYRSVARSQSMKIVEEHIDAIALISPSSVHRLATSEGEGLLQRGIPLLAAGEATARAMEEAGLPVAAVSADVAVTSLVDLTIQHLGHPSAEI